MTKNSIIMLLLLLLLPQPVLGDRPVSIVSLDLCTDWILLTYAIPGQVKAYSPYLYQFNAEWVEPGLPTHNGSLEQIVTLKPDLIISGEFNAQLLRERLRQLNFMTEVLHNPVSLKEVDSYIQRVKNLIQVDSSGDRLILLTDYPSRHESLLLLGANGIGTGRATLEHDIIAAAGWNNYLTLPGYQPLDLEKLVTDPPDAVYWTVPDTQSLAGKFAQHRALRKKISAKQWIGANSWRWHCPGPWTHQLIQELAAWKKP